MTDAEKERAAIVAWLYEQRTKHIVMSNSSSLSLQNRADAHKISRACLDMAEHIQRGDHLQETANP